MILNMYLEHKSMTRKFAQEHSLYGYSVTGKCEHSSIVAKEKNCG